MYIGRIASQNLATKVRVRGKGRQSFWAKKNYWRLFWIPLREQKWLGLVCFSQVRLRRSTLMCNHVPKSNTRRWSRSKWRTGLFHYLHNLNRQRQSSPEEHGQHQVHQKDWQPVTGARESGFLLSAITLQQIEETGEGEAIASGGLASVTISTISAAAAAAMQERLNIAPVHFLKRGNGQIEQKWMSIAFLIIGWYGDYFQ